MNDGTETRAENRAAIASWMSGSSGRTMIDALIAEQQQLTAVERFAHRHEEGELPAQARYYRDLIPVRGPHAGEQFAFAVDLDACSGCKGCVSACHALNGLDDDEVWREVGLLHGSSGAVSYQQTITTACHHCVEPACLEGCPVMAYEKDSMTGIVRHLDDQCIGCQYCVLKCPYDVPKYSVRRGIVRKCDMCHGRLSAGEAPACVQACPNEAISIRLVDKAAITAMSLPGRSLVPDAFPSDYTKPTTIYASARMRPANTRAADVHALRVEPAHWPLIGMTVLTQWATGIFAAVTLITFFANEPSDRIAATLSKTGFALLVTGLAISVLHLGRPAGAWRFFLGLRTSWMSREILAFGFFGAASTALAWWPDVARCLGVPGGNVTLFAPLVALLGIGSLFCSAMIYVDTRRAFWGSALTFPKFFGTAVTLGAGATACVLSDGAREIAIGVAMVSFAALFGWEASHWFCALKSSNAPTHRSARTIWELQRPVLVARGAIVLAAISASVLAMNAWGMMLALSLMVAAQLMERYFFFTAVVAPRMPGGVAS